jgi:ABC-2 type transport system ATP-binding protein
MGKHPTLAIEIEGLVKVFGDIRAVDGLDLTVPVGGVYGFLGPNGAGKTTTIRVLATLLTPDEGVARVLGHDVVLEADEVRRRVSLTGQFASVDDDLTARENLILLGRLLGHSRAGSRGRANDLLSAFRLESAADRLVRRLSGGLRRRLDIAASIVVTPDLVFLDEPTTGLDPHSRNQVWDIVRALVAEGATVLLTTQYLEEADQLADRIAVIDHGRLIAEGSPGDLKQSVGSGVLQVRLFDSRRREDAVAILSPLLGGPVQREADDRALSAPVFDSERVVAGLAGLNSAGIEVGQFSFGQPTLDEVFLTLTGHPATGEGDVREVESA